MPTWRCLGLFGSRLLRFSGLSDPSQGVVLAPPGRFLPDPFGHPPRPRRCRGDDGPKPLPHNGLGLAVTPPTHAITHAIRLGGID